VEPKIKTKSKQESAIVGHIFGTPVVVKGWTWLPISELAAWAGMAWLAARQDPERTWRQRFQIGALTMPVVLGSEWGHNLAHTAAAYLIGKPVHAFRIAWGMPLLVYHDLEEEDVTPIEHITRSAVGPIFNTVLLGCFLLLKWLSGPVSITHEAAKAGVAANAFLSSVSLLPIPGIDGGPILKWSLVARGQTTREADETVRKTNWGLGALLTLFSGLLLKRRKYVLGGFLGMMAGIAFGVATGRLREKPGGFGGYGDSRAAQWRRVPPLETPAPCHIPTSWQLEAPS